MAVSAQQTMPVRGHAGGDDRPAEMGQPGLYQPGLPASITRCRTSHPRRTPRVGRLRVGGRDQLPLTNERAMRVVSRGTFGGPVGMPRRPERR